MIDKRRILINALVSVLQVAVTSLTLFFLYGYLVARVGKEDFGAWALVVAAASAAGISNLGFAGSALKFVSQHRANGDEAEVDRTIQTATLAVAVFVGATLLVASPLLARLVAFVVEPATKVPIALAILPYALGSFWLGAIAAVLQSCLDGLHRIDLRGAIAIATAIAYWLLAIVLVERGGIVGLAQAQLASAGLAVMGSWIVLKRQRPALPLVTVRWNRSSFLSMWRYGLGTQVISVSQVLVEPTTKALLSKLGGVGAVASFEMAYRLVLQLRNVVTTALMALTPTFADLAVRAPERIRQIYLRTARLLVAGGIAILPLLLAVTPLVSRLWLGHLDRPFVIFASLLFGAWSLNVLASPAYFANLGTGKLAGNVWSHVAIASINLLAGWLLGRAFGGMGVVAAYALAVGCGSAAITIQFHLANAIPPRELTTSDTMRLALAGLGGLVVATVGGLLLRSHLGVLGLSAWVALAYAAAVILPAWRHSARRQVADWIAGAAT